MRAMLAVLLCLPALVSCAPTTSACTYTPIVTIGGSSHPAEGIYLEDSCYFVSGTSRVTVEYAFATSVMGACQVVPPVFVLGQQVPGTGATYCTPAVAPGSGQFVVDPGSYPDVGFEVCNYTADVPVISGCTIYSTYYVNWACEALPTLGWIALPTGDQVRVDCAAS